MPALAATNLHLAYGERVVLTGVSLSVEPGERIGLVGRNGTGKSSLLRVLAGELGADSGTVSVQQGTTAGYLSQEPRLPPDATLREAAAGALAPLHLAIERLERAHAEVATASGDEAALRRAMDRQARLEREVEALGGYAVDHRVEQVLHGLGFEDAQFGVRVRDLSGGQRGRLAIARLLLAGHGVLLLDEPTNHLDIEGRRWLERFLTSGDVGAVVLVSHDRRMLSTVVSRIVEIEDGRLIDYPGSYEQFRTLRAERRLAMLRAWEKQQVKFRQEEAYIRRYKAGQRAKQARGRETRLEREKAEGALERPTDAGVMRLRLDRAPRAGDLVAVARGIGKAYPNHDGSTTTLFASLDLTIGRGERWGIIGPNGSGKTTLVRCLLGELEADSGTARLGSGVRVGYFRQSQQHLPADEPVYRYLQGVIQRENPGATMSEQEARDLAGAFLFSGDEQAKALGVLSGGERARAELAALLASAKNLLVLDEPTNHLDIPSAERLEEALAAREEGGYDGTLILISHDRALIDGVCDHILVLDGRGGATAMEGNYSDWLRRTEEAQAEEIVPRVRERAPAKAAAPRAAPVDDGKRRSRYSWMPTERIESRLAELDGEMRAIDQRLADPSVWQPSGESGALTARRGELDAERAALEDEWLHRSV